MLTLAALLGAAGPAGAGELWERLKASGEIRVGMDPAFPPLEAVDRQGRLVGFDVDLAGLIAESLGLRLRLVNMLFPELLPALQNGRLDLVISGVTMTAQRNCQVVFVGPYLVAGQTLLLAKGLAGRVRSPADLDRPEFRLAATRQTTAEAAARRVMPRAQLMVVASEQEAFQLVVGGQADALVADLPFNAYMAFRHRQAGLTHMDSPFTFEPLGIALGDDAHLANWLENFLFMLKGTGRLEMLNQRWFKDAGWMKEMEANRLL